MQPCTRPFLFLGYALARALGAGRYVYGCAAAAASNSRRTGTGTARGQATASAAGAGVMEGGGRRCLAGGWTCCGYLISVVSHQSRGAGSVGLAVAAGGCMGGRAGGSWGSWELGPQQRAREVRQSTDYRTNQCPGDLEADSAEKSRPSQARPLLGAKGFSVGRSPSLLRRRPRPNALPVWASAVEHDCDTRRTGRNQ